MRKSYVSSRNLRRHWCLTVKAAFGEVKATALVARVARIVNFIVIGR